MAGAIRDDVSRNAGADATRARGAACVCAPSTARDAWRANDPLHELAVIPTLTSGDPRTGQSSAATISPGYRSTALRHPKEPLVIIPQTLSELTGPVYPYGRMDATDNDLTRQHAGEPLGERIIVAGPRPRRGRPAGAARRWSRSGRRMPPAATRTRSISTRRRSIRTFPARAER